jgi:outer membrane protein assembly factor BamB
MFSKKTFSACFSLALTVHSLHAEDWSQFRGPASNGVVQAMKLPEVWDASSAIQWKARIPGEGWSAPIVVGQKVFLTTAVSTDQKNRDFEHTWKVICLDASSGNILWAKDAIKSKPRLGTHRDNTYASETPATDGKHIVVYFGMMGLFCYDLEGNELWKKDLGSFPMQNEWGTSSSPIIHNQTLYLQIDNEKASFLVALDVASGKEKWRKSREETSNWGSPIIWKNAMRTELVTAGRIVRSYNPADGTLWWQATLNAGGVSSTPSGNDDLLIVGNQGRQGAGMMVVKAGAQGDITLKPGETSNAGILWSTQKFGPQRSSPLLLNGQIFLPGNRDGMLNCVDAKTGTVIYQERIPEAGAFWASPWSYNGLAYCPDEKGNTFVLKPGPTLNVLRVNRLPEDDARFWATTAAGNGALYIRSTNHIYAISAR